MKQRQKKHYQIEDMNQGFDSGFVHGINILLNPVTQNQIKFQKTTLLAPIQQSIHTKKELNKPNQTLYFLVRKWTTIPVDRYPLLLFVREINLKVLWTRRVPGEEPRPQINSISKKQINGNKLTKQNHILRRG